MTVGELLARMSSHEISEWGVYFKIEAAEREQNSPNSGQTTSFANSGAVQTMGGQSLPDG